MRQGMKKFIASAVGVGAVGVALPVIATGSAYASGERCGKAAIEYSLNDGKTWTTAGRMDDALVTKIKVRLKTPVENTCEYAVSLASYSTEGPTWATSGKQAFLGWDTTKLSRDQREDTLDVSAFVPKCFGQVDLYGNGKKFDGTENPLPRYPNGVFPHDLITAWNGGEKCETPTTPPTTAKPPTTAPATSKPPTGTPSASAPSTSAPATVKPTSSTTAPAAGGGETTPPRGNPEVPPVTDIAPASLAQTGGDSNTSLIVGVSAGALLVGGAGALVWSRRRNSGGTPA